MCNPFMAEVEMGADIGRALDRLGAFPAKVARAVTHPSPHGWLHTVTSACGEDNHSFVCLLEQVEDIIDEFHYSGEGALRTLAGAMMVMGALS